MAILHPVTKVCAFAALGGIMFGMDMGNWSAASNRPDFLDIFCKGGGFGDEKSCVPDGKDQTQDWAFMVGLLAGILQIGAAVCALVIAPICAGIFNRRTCLSIGCIASDIGLLVMVLSRSIMVMAIGRFVLGLGIGLTTYSLMIYLSEISPKETRGKNSSYFQLATVIGVVLAALLSIPRSWHWWAAFVAPMIPATIVAVGSVLFLPTSPRWLVQNGRTEEAREVMLYLRQGADAEAVHAELAEIQETIEDERNATKNAKWSDLMLPGIWQRVVAAIGLVFFQQFCGINSIVTFGDLFFETAGLKGQKAVIGVLLSNASNLLGMVFLLFVIDRWGRRFLLQASAVIMLTGWLGCAILNGVTDPENISTDMGWLMVGFVMLFELGFGVGYGAIAWVYPSEIFPFVAKSRGMSVMVFAEYAFNFAIVVGFPPVQKAVGTEIVAFIFAGLCAVSIVFVHFWVPETKGLSLEEMDSVFGDGYRSMIDDANDHMMGDAKKKNHLTKRFSRASSAASSTAALAVIP